MVKLTLPSRSADAGTALLIVDMISDFEFEDGERLFENAARMVPNIRSLKKRYKKAGIPVVYVNDEIANGRSGLVDDIHSLKNRSSKAGEILFGLEPEKDDLWIVKPQRSGFYATALGNVLMSLGAHSVVVTGITTDICVLFTAHDAYMRGFSVAVPRDCCAAADPDHHEEALRFLSRVAETDIAPSGISDHPAFENDVAEFAEQLKVGTSARAIFTPS